jgi:hypothetical protein
LLCINGTTVNPAMNVSASSPATTTAARERRFDFAGSRCFRRLGTLPPGAWILPETRRRTKPGIGRNLLECGLVHASRSLIAMPKLDSPGAPGRQRPLFDDSARPTVRREKRRGTETVPVQVERGPAVEDEPVK